MLPEFSPNNDSLSFCSVFLGDRPFKKSESQRSNALPCFKVHRCIGKLQVTPYVQPPAFPSLEPPEHDDQLRTASSSQQSIRSPSRILDLYLTKGRESRLIGNTIGTDRQTHVAPSLANLRQYGGVDFDHGPPSRDPRSTRGVSRMIDTLRLRKRWKPLRS